MKGGANVYEGVVSSETRVRSTYLGVARKEYRSGILDAVWGVLCLYAV